MDVPLYNNLFLCYYYITKTNGCKEEKEHMYKKKLGQTYYTNRHSCFLLQYHIVLITKYRRPVLTGAVVNEALTMGLYVVTSNHCGASYLLKDRQQGIVFNLESSSSLNNVIDTCIANRDWIRKTVNERIAWSKDHISCKAVAHYFMQNL